ncbi:MAG TPA: thioredoxin family protein [Pyrinomonadaceae bacterium]|jgi:thiol:disulfide interchange protein
MKQTIYILVVILAGSFAAFGQTTKEKIDIKITKPVEEREVFDPKKDPNADLKAAVAKAQKENKRIILDIGGEWCGWCRHMDKFFTLNPALGKIREENFIWVKVNMSEENENKEFLSKYPEIPGYPHLFVLEKDGSLLQSQNTSELEQEKTYNLQKFTDFLTKWSPAKTSESMLNSK